MSKIELVDEKTISSHYLSYLVNGDSSGLDDNDKRLLDDFLEHYDLDTKIVEVSDDSSFCRDQVTGLHSDCHNVKFFGVKS